MNWALLQNSLLVSGLTTLLSVSLGFVAALWYATVKPWWRSKLLALSVVALVLPPFLVTNCWLELLGNNGSLRSWLPFDIYSLGGAVLILTSLTWPISLLATLSAWERLQPSQLEIDPALHGLSLIRWLLWPMARRLVGLAAVLIFVLALNNFAVPTILQVKVFPAELWVRYSTNLDPLGSLAVSWPLILAPLVLIWILQRQEISWPAQENAITARAFRRQLGPGCYWSSGALAVLALAISVGLPAIQLIGGARGWMEFPSVLASVPGTIWNSFWFAALAAALGLGLGLASWRVPIGSCLWLPLLVPGVLLGIGLLLLFNRPLLQWIYGGPIIVIMAWTIRYLALPWHGVAYAMRARDRDLTDAALLDGASGWNLLRHVHWPQLAAPLGVAWYVTYLLCLWDVETIILVMPPGRETLALRIFNLLHYGHNAQVNALCMVLLGLAIAPLVMVLLARWLLNWTKR